MTRKKACGFTVEKWDKGPGVKGLINVKHTNGEKNNLAGIPQIQKELALWKKILGFISLKIFLSIYIHIPWPFPPVWGVADNAEKTASY